MAKSGRRWFGRAAACAIALTLAMEAGAAPMGADTARAMLERFGYGASAVLIERNSGLSVEEYLARGINSGSQLPASTRERIAAMRAMQPAQDLWQEYGPGSAKMPLGDLQKSSAQINFALSTHALVREAIEIRLLSMANTDNPAHEALLSFWLNHFSIYAPKHFDRLLARDYADAIERVMRADSFEALLRASFYHPAMQLYLDNTQSTAPDSVAAQRAEEKGKTLGINENLARELLELHTLGVDAGYTQQDVQELARILTGAGVWVPKMREQALRKAGATRDGLFLFDPRRHDFGAKTLLGTAYPAGRGIAEVDAALHQLAVHPATARHLSTQLAVRFVSDQPSPQLIERMTAAWQRSNGKISRVLDAMVDTQEFRDSLVHRAKFKEPVDYVLSAAKAACQDQPIDNGGLLILATLDMGQTPFMKTTPDGYPARESDWLSPAAMAKRARLAMGLAAAKVPLRDGPPPDEQSPLPRANAAERTAAWQRGTVCSFDPAAVERSAGALSAGTTQALAGLAPGERAAAVLASPEFLRR